MAASLAAVLRDDYLRPGRRRIATTAEALRLRLGVDSRPLDATLPPLPARPRVLFLCLGNICRSPMAERYARDRLADAGIAVDSAGFIEREGRPSPAPAVDAAREFGVDLDPHRSRHVTSADLADSDLVLVMDAGNYRALRRRRPGAVDRTRFLGVFSIDGTPAVEADGGRTTRTVTFSEARIADPYGSDVATFRRTYAEIARAVDGLVDRLTARTDG